MAGSSNNNFMNFIVNRWVFLTNPKDIGTFPGYRMMGLLFSFICIGMGVSKITIMKFCITPVYASLNVNTIALVLTIFIYAGLFSFLNVCVNESYNFRNATMVVGALVVKLLTFTTIYIGMQELITNNLVMLVSLHAFIVSKFLIF